MSEVDLIAESEAAYCFICRRKRVAVARYRVICLARITNYREVFISHCNGSRKPTQDAYSTGHLVLSHVGLAFVLMLKPFFSEHVMFPNFVLLF